MWSLSCCTLTAGSTHTTLWSCVCVWPSSLLWRWPSLLCCSLWVCGWFFSPSLNILSWYYHLTDPPPSVSVCRYAEPSSRCCSPPSLSTGCVTLPSLSFFSPSSTCWLYLLPTFWASLASLVSTAPWQTPQIHHHVDTLKSCGQAANTLSYIKLD